MKNKLSNKINVFALIALVVLLGGFILIDNYEGITGFAILKTSGIINILADTTSPTIELNTTLPSNITTNLTLILSANFSDNDTGFVGNITLNELNDSSTGKNLSFTWNQNSTIYIKLLKNISVTNATINLTGYVSERLTGYRKGPGDTSSLGNAEDNNWDSYATIVLDIFNVTIPYDGIGGRSWIYKYWTTGCDSYNPDDYITYTCYNYSNNLWANVSRVRYGTFSELGYSPSPSTIVIENYSLPEGCLQDPIQLSLNTCGGYFYYYEANIEGNTNQSLNSTNYPTNPYLEVGTIDGAYEWNHSGVFNGTNTTSDFSSAINSYLSTCSVDNDGYCHVPLFLNSSIGVIKVSNINVTYDVNQSCEICLASDGVCDTEWTGSNVTTNYSSDNKSGNCSFLWNTTDYSDANYNISFRIRDVINNVNTSSKQIILDRDAPNVARVYPMGNGAFNVNVTNLTNMTKTLSFIYNVNDLSSIASCSLILNGEINHTDTSIQKGTEQTLGVNISTTINGTRYYNWSINCTDIFDRTSSFSAGNFTFIVTGNFSGKTTDLTTVNVSNISNLTFEEVNYGRLHFYQSVALQRLWDIYQHVKIASNRIEINSTAAPELNQSALLYLYGLSYSNPRILIDGAVCPSSICRQIAYVAGILTFNVTHFSVYSADETPSSEAGGGGGSGGAGGAGGTVPLVCRIGTIQCVGLTQYQECLKEGSANKWSETRIVPEGKECKFGMLKEIEVREAVEEEKPAEPIPQPPVLEEVLEEPVKGFEWKKSYWWGALIAVGLIIITSLIVYWWRKR